MADADKLAWALDYLRGRAKAMARGKITLNNLEGAVRHALARGATIVAVESVLAGYNLCWDTDSNTLVPCEDSRALTQGTHRSADAARHGSIARRKAT
jgi:hypothetical protein